MKRFKKQIRQARKKGQLTARVRKDVVRRIIEKKEYKLFIRNYCHTDDYAYDAKHGGRKELTHEEALKVANRWLAQGRGDTYCGIDVHDPNKVMIIPYHNLSYTMVLE